jgi:hypothetical protein
MPSLLTAQRLPLIADALSLDVHLIRTISRSLAVLALALPTAAFAAGTVSGTVTNKTNNKPAAGDTVTLVRLTQGMQDANSTTTDSHGHYKLEIADADVVHLIRVTHQKASYFHPLQPGTDTADIDVYDAAEKIEGVSTNVVELHIEAEQNELHIVEIIQVLNDSAPARTQFGPNGFDFYIPADARIVRSGAFRDSMPVPANAVPVGDPGHYKFLFPIRPGDTKFGIFYSIPYTGSYKFDPRLVSPTTTYAVVLPQSMKLTPGSGTPYTTSNQSPDRQTFVAHNAQPSQPLSFTITGTGTLPAEKDDQSGQAPNAGPMQGGSGAPLPETQNTNPGRGLQNPLDPDNERNPLGKYQWWILGGLAVILAIGAGVLLRKPTAAATIPTSSPTPQPPLTTATRHDILLQALKEELFSLETDHLQNHISEADYAQQKSALETVLRRALNRKENSTV